MNPPATAHASHHELERRLVSVLFCDLVGFTTFSESRDHEHVREVLGYYFDDAREIVTRYGGTVNKFIGDAVMATWGSPVAHEDDAERAVRAALDIVDSVKVLAERLGESSLELRAGVLTGEAAVNPGAENEGMVIGDMVNTASRIQSVAEPGTVLVGESTYRSSSHSIAFDSAGQVSLKGKDEPVNVWRALHVTARAGADRSAGIEPPFVGRDGDLRTLKELLHATESEARPRLVSIGGIAGVGKSRLVQELSRYVDGISRVILWHEGRSPSYGEGVTFWALAEMVRMRARIAEDDDDTTARIKLAEALDKIRIEPTERTWIERALTTLLGLDGRKTEESPESLFPAWRTFFERLAEKNPTVLIFQDLQWADEGTISFIEHMFEWTRTGPILIVVLFRPEFLDRRPTWGVGQRNFASLHLDPLPGEAMGRLLDGVVVDLPEDARERIVERAEGVPLYAVEMIRTMIDRGHLIPHNGRYQVGAEIGDLEVPESLHALIASRLDALSSQESAITQQASVLGQTFTLQSLAALTGMNEIELTAVLRDLSRRELLYLEVDPVSPERGQYGFVQSMIREVAYSTIAHRNRMTMHVAAAEYFEGLEEIELASVISTHYFAAYELATDPEEARRLADKAVTTLVESAERAASLGSYDQALAQLMKAADLAPEDGKPALRRSAAETALSAGRFVEAERLSEEVASSARQRGDRDDLIRMAIVRAQALRDLGRYELEIEVLAEPLGWEDDSLPGMMRAKALQSQAYMLSGQPKEALHWSERTLESPNEFDDPAAIVDALITRGVVVNRDGRVLESLVYMIGAEGVAQRFELDEARGRSLINLSAIMSEFDTASANEVALEALDHARSMGSRWLELNHLSNTFTLGLQLGRWDWIEETAREMFGDDPLAMIDRSLSGAQCQYVLASITAFRGGHDLAFAFLERIDAQGEIEDEWTASELLLDRSRVAAASGDWSAAYAWAAQGAAHADIVSSEWLPVALPAALLNEDEAGLQQIREWLGARKLHDPRRTGWLAAADGADAALENKLSEAAGHFSDAAGFFRGVGERFALTMIQLTAAKVLAGDEGLARKPAEEARDLMLELGATALLSQLP